MNKSAMYMAVMTALIASGAGAVDATAPRSRTERPAAARPAAGQERQADTLASEFGVTKNEVNGLRQRGLGWGEVRQALTLSRESGKPVDEIVRMHDQGMSWGDISKKEGVKFDVSGKPLEKKGSAMDRGPRDIDTNRGTRDTDTNRGTRDTDTNRDTRGGTMDRGTERPR